MNISAKSSNIFIIKKNENRGLKHIILHFSKVKLSYIHQNWLQNLF